LKANNILLVEKAPKYEPPRHFALLQRFPFKPGKLLDNHAADRTPDQHRRGEDKPGAA
jgi:hypothetical protein